MLIRPTCLLALAFVPLSTACADRQPPAVVTRVQIERVQIPPGLLRCPDQPEPPAEPVSEADAASYILDLAAAGDDCRRRLGEVRDLIEKTPE